MRTLVVLTAATVLAMAACSGAPLAQVGTVGTPEPTPTYDESMARWQSAFDQWYRYTRTGLVDLNTAGAADLRVLMSTGDQYVRAVMAYRVSNPIDTIAELDAVPGVGQAQVDAVRACACTMQK